VFFKFFFSNHANDIWYGIATAAPAAGGAAAAVAGHSSGLLTNKAAATAQTA